MSRGNAEAVLAAALERPARVGGRCRVIAVDGQAGAGKTTLAAGVAQAAKHMGTNVEVIHLDDLYDGWRGVLRVNELVASLLRSLHREGQAAYRRYDWHRGAYAEVREVVLPDLLLLEGVGAGPPACDPLLTLRVWVSAPREVRLERGLRRDGEQLRAQWLQFLTDEEQVHARDRTRDRADLLLDGQTGEVTASAAPARHEHR